MKKIRIVVVWVLVLSWCAMVGMPAGDALAGITPEDAYKAEALRNPNPPVFTFHSSIAIFNNDLIYAGNDGKIYAYDVVGKTSTLVSDTSLLSMPFATIQGFYVSSDDYLYFHDNAIFYNIYRLKLTDAWPAAYETLVTGFENRPIFGFAENPVTGTIWFSASDFFGAGNNFYLYQISSDFQSISLNLTFPQPNSGGNGPSIAGNGPIIFEDETTLLYGEAVIGGNGYFHRIDTDSKRIIQKDYLTFSDGLGDATYGTDDRLFVTTGGGKAIFEIDGTQKTRIATADDETRGIAFDGTDLYISAMVPYSGSTDDGKVSLFKLREKSSDEDVTAAAGCFINSADPGILHPTRPLSYLLILMTLCFAIGIAARFGKGQAKA